MGKINFETCSHKEFADFLRQQDSEREKWLKWATEISHGRPTSVLTLFVVRYKRRAEEACEVARALYWQKTSDPLRLDAEGKPLHKEAYPWLVGDRDISKPDCEDENA